MISIHSSRFTVFLVHRLPSFTFASSGKNAEELKWGMAMLELWFACADFDRDLESSGKLIEQVIPHVRAPREETQRTPAGCRARSHVQKRNAPRKQREFTGANGKHQES
jgi:hypothetical protein